MPDKDSGWEGIEVLLWPLHFMLAIIVAVWLRISSIAVENSFLDKAEEGATPN